MNILSKLLTILLIVALLAASLTSCIFGSNNECNEHIDANFDRLCDNCGESMPPVEPCEIHVDNNRDSRCDVCGTVIQSTAEFIDYVTQLKFDPNSGRANAKVTVAAYIDGDTTHFNVGKDNFGNTVVEGDFLKARYLGINTPESTGGIEPWGKKASNYTKEQLSNAVGDIYIESDTSEWNIDSTGERYLVWVWYKTTADGEYRNLNLEILQQGLAFGSNAASNAYSSYTMGALNQAKNFSLHVFSNEKDPNFYYGEAIEVTLRELKLNSEKYEDKLVRFEAITAKTVGPTIYVEMFDEETQMYFGMQIFAGYDFPVSEYFQIGNKVSIVGKLTYYANGGTYQVSDLKCRLTQTNNPKYCYVVEKGHTPSYYEISADNLLNGKITLETIVETIDPETGESVEELVSKTYDYGNLAHYSTVSMNNLTVTRTPWMTDSTTDSDGALTITCEDENGTEIKIRTSTQFFKTDENGDFLYDEEGKQIPLVPADFPIGTKISVRGIVDSYQGSYQIRVFQIKDIIFDGAN